MKRRSLLLLCLAVFSLQVTSFGAAKSSKRISLAEYIAKWSPVAQKHMKEFGIPASIILAQGILESGYGNSRMARMANNHFGIKALGWDGEEYKQVNWERGSYRKYADTEDCYRDHARIISTKDRYAYLFELDEHDYQSWAYGLKRAGYAEDRKYPNLLIKTIEDNQLYRFDTLRLEAITDMKVFYYDIPAESTGVTQAMPVVIAKGSAGKKKEFTAPVISIASLEDPTRHVDSTYAVPAEAVLVLPRTNVKYVIAKAGDTFESIAEEQELTVKKLLEYNDLDNTRELKKDEPVFIAPKRKTADFEVHILENGQTLWDVAQLYGVALKELEKRNRLRKGRILMPGTAIQLQ